MKNLLLVLLVFAQSCMAFAQNCCENDSVCMELRFPLTERDTETVFYYFNGEWIRGAHVDRVPADSIQKIEVKNDEYGNRALFLTVPPHIADEIKAEAQNLYIHDYPICEFPGGNGKLKEWIDSNIQIPEGFKGCELVTVNMKIHPDGSISDTKIVRPSKNQAANEEALRLVNALPKFRLKYFTPQKKSFHYYITIPFTEPGAIFIRGDKKNTRPE
ncbi:MAG: TonB C-terminal domain-containing protein [Muribaculaceae bacterium]|nr:TonB C-terminal domain-containing protein [Muribaculaceae bacterium]